MAFESESNDSTSTANDLTLGTSTTGQVATNTDEDYFKQAFCQFLRGLFSNLDLQLFDTLLGNSWLIHTNQIPIPSGIALPDRYCLY